MGKVVKKTHILNLSLQMCDEQTNFNIIQMNFLCFFCVLFYFLFFLSLNHRITNSN